MAMQLNQNHVDIPTTPPSIATALRSWFAVYTASNHEKRVAQYLQVKGIGAGQTNDAAIGGVSQYLGPAIIARRYDPSKTPGAPSLGNLFGTGGNGWPVTTP